VRGVNGNCERAREWASLELDGELSTFERALLEAHLEGCRTCTEFSSSISGLTGALRSAPHERLGGVVIGGHVRRRVRMRLAPAAAAMAVAAVGLGSIVASSSLKSGPVGRLGSGIDVAPAAASAASSAGPDTMNLSTSRALERASDRPAGRLPAGANGTLRGGPVVFQR
jgi:predicted anti-sigma-YlaC factor YlaD